MIVNPALGIEKLFLIFNSRREILTTLNAILSYTGDERRIAFFFVNEELINRSNPWVLPCLEEIATTVVRVIRKEREFRFSIVKSINNEVEGVEIKT